MGCETWFFKVVLRRKGCVFWTNMDWWTKWWTPRFQRKRPRRCWASCQIGSESPLTNTSDDVKNPHWNWMKLISARIYNFQFLLPFYQHCNAKQKKTMKKNMKTKNEKTSKMPNTLHNCMQFPTRCWSSPVLSGTFRAKESIDAGVNLGGTA